MRACRRWMQWSVVAALHLGTVPATASESAPVQLVIEMSDLARVPAVVMRETKAAVERTFLASGVRIVWVDSANRHTIQLRSSCSLSAVRGRLRESTRSPARRSSDWRRMSGTGHRCSTVAWLRPPPSARSRSAWSSRTSLRTSSGTYCCRRTAMRPSASCGGPSIWITRRFVDSPPNNRV
jgi:hypothetical protein